MMAEASRAFAERRPADDSFATAVVALQMRGLFPEVRTWVDDYQHAPAVTQALLKYLVTPPPREWPGSQANLQRELRARPRDQTTLDLAIAAWRQGRQPATVNFLHTFDLGLIEATLKVGPISPAQAVSEWRLFACQSGQCTVADVPHLINSARSDAASSRDSYRGPGRLDAHRAALVSLGGPAVPALIALYDDASSALSTLAAAALAEIDEPALVSLLASEIQKAGAPALKALGALHATPAESLGPNRLLMEALSSTDSQISDVALTGLRQRLTEQDLVDVLGYVADRDRFTVREVVAYEGALKSAGANAGDYVAETMNRMLDAAGDPRRPRVDPEGHRASRPPRRRHDQGARRPRASPPRSRGLCVDHDDRLRRRPEQRKSSRRLVSRGVR